MFRQKKGLLALFNKFFILLCIASVSCSGNSGGDDGSPDDTGSFIFDWVDPVFKSGAVGSTDKTTVTLVFSEELENVSAAGFTLCVNRAVVAISSCSGSDKSIDLVLASAVPEDAQVIVRYDSAAGTITDTAENRLESFDFKLVSNGSTDSGNSAEFKEAIIDENMVVIGFSGNITCSSTGGFSISVNGSPVSVMEVFENTEDSIVLTLETPAALGDDVTLEYDSASQSLLDSSRNPVASFGPVSVTVGYPPVLSFESINNIDTDTLVFGCSENLLNASSDGITVRVNGLVVAISSVVFAETSPGSGYYNLSLNLSSPVAEGDIVTVSYDSGTGNITDMNGIEMESFGPLAYINEIDNTPPAFIDATVYFEYSMVAVTFNETNMSTSADGFIIRINGTETAITGIDTYQEYDGDAGNTMLLLTVENQVNETDVVTVEYSSDSGTTADSSGNAVQSFGPETATRYTDDMMFTIETFANGGGSGADTSIAIYDENFNLLSAYDPDDQDNNNYYSNIKYPLVSGKKYYLKVRDGRERLGFYYSILVSKNGGGSSTVVPDPDAGEPNNDFAHATALTAGTVYDSCFAVIGESDFYVITMP